MRNVIFALGVLCVLGATANAAPVCFPDTVAAYEALGAGGCTINGVLFKNWTFVADAGTPATADDVGITPDATQVGFDAFIGLNAFRNAIRGLTISYIAVITQSNMAELHVHGHFLGAGQAQVTTSLGGQSIIVSAIPAGEGIGTLTFSPPLAGPDILVSNYVYVSANGTSAQVGSFENYLSAVPEPATMLLLGGGLLALGLARRKRR